MTHIVTYKCVDCKYTSCVDACPVSCFYEGENMLVIDPETCIDCQACVDQCPVDAIIEYPAETTDDSLLELLELNYKYSAIWPQINETKDPLPNAEESAKIKNKKHLLIPSSTKNQ